MRPRVLPTFERLGAVAWRSRPIMGMHVSTRATERRFGEPCGRDEDSNGCGLFDWWTLRFPCGLEVGFELLQLRPDGTWEIASDPDEDRELTLFANQPVDHDHLLFHLGIEGITPLGWSPQATFQDTRAHIVMRQDDNGNVVEVARYTTSCEAEGRRDALEAAGHRQLYWTVRPATG